MTVFKHEMKRGKLSLIIWTAIIAFMLAVCVFIYPEMSTQMNEISDMFANMGSFSSAFGLDQLNFGEFIHTECTRKSTHIREHFADACIRQILDVYHFG